MKRRTEDEIQRIAAIERLTAAIDALKALQLDPDIRGRMVSGVRKNYSEKCHELIDAFAVIRADLAAEKS